MKLSFPMTLAWGLIVGLAIPATAGPCTAELNAYQPKVDALVDSTAGSGKFAPESEAATQGRQPTPDSIAFDGIEFLRRALSSLE